MKDIKLLKRGSLLCLVLALASCRNDPPPELSWVGIGDGRGGADGADHQGKKIYKKPSELEGYWMTSEVDEANLMSWCYGSTASETQSMMNRMKQKMKLHE